jgi:hypothetical protein
MEAHRRSLVAIVLSSLLVLALAGTAAAQPQRQEGLVNVIVGDVVVQLPIAVAANVCDVNVNVLARQVRLGGAECEAAAESGATVPWRGQRSGPQQQEGLVNVIVGDIFVQAPIGIAANICDVNANVLAEQVRLGGAQCEAEATAIANGG